MRRVLAKAAWCVLFFLALINAIFAMRYLLPHVPMASSLPNFKLHRVALAGHAAFSGIALLLGPIQFLGSIRRRWRPFHRRVGWVYVCTVGLGAAFAAPLTLHAAFGRVTGVGFLTLDILWPLFTAIAVRWAVRGRFDLHHRWMLRGYALTAAAISLRIMLPASVMMGLSFSSSYRAIAWLCWLTNLAIVETWLHFNRDAGTQVPLNQESVA